MRATRRRVLGAGIVGNVLEWYDFALYGYLAPVISTLFFPSHEPLTSLINTYAVFALGFLARPLGGMLLGGIGDRRGRRVLLIASTVLMALPTALIGALPTFERAGLWAPILLCLLRLLQGLSTGGEFVGSITFLVEQAPPGRRALYGSLANAGAILGGLLGAAAGWMMAAVVSADAMREWGWRVPFLSGVLVGLCGLWIRIGIPDSPTYRMLQESGAVATRPVRTALRLYARQMALTLGLNWVASAGYYIVFVWYVTDMSAIIRVAYPTALGIGTLGLVAGFVATPLMGRLSDRVGPRRVLSSAALATAIASVPLLIVADTGTIAAGAAAQLGLVLLMAALLGPLPAVLVSLFDPAVRCSGLAIGYNLAPALFGGTAPLVATVLVDRSGWAPAPGLYLAAAASVLLVLIRFVPRDAAARGTARATPWTIRNGGRSARRSIGARSTKSNPRDRDR